MTPYHKQAFINSPQADNEDAQAVLAIHEHNLEGLYALQAEAVTVHHETGLGPRQLAQQRAELIAALTSAMHQLESVQLQAEEPMAMPWPSIEHARAVLAQCKEQP